MHDNLNTESIENQSITPKVVITLNYTHQRELREASALKFSIIGFFIEGKMTQTTLRFVKQLHCLSAAIFLNIKRLLTRTRTVRVEFNCTLYIRLQMIEKDLLKIY